MVLQSSNHITLRRQIWIIFRRNLKTSKQLPVTQLCCCMKIDNRGGLHDWSKPRYAFIHLWLCFDHLWGLICWPILPLYQPSCSGGSQGTDTWWPWVWRVWGWVSFVVGSPVDISWSFGIGPTVRVLRWFICAHFIWGDWKTWCLLCCVWPWRRNSLTEVNIWRCWGIYWYRSLGVGCSTWGPPTNLVCTTLKMDLLKARIDCSNLVRSWRDPSCELGRSPLWWWPTPISMWPSTWCSCPCTWENGASLRSSQRCW